MESVKKILHIRSKSKSASSQSESPGTSDAQAIHDIRPSFDEEVAAMSPDERKAYLAEFEEAERTGHAKKGSLLERLIERGNRKTEEQLAREAREAREREALGTR
ncbi:hypothetical protein GQ43DRAFT_474252 [Delitschia confertaspora ATCC 74209]|uniref:Uncharacterized protein n=1 Tax=Delitschia confertaspora ATCC 74209 TaxID=1513339 RepID=A0A9P4JKE4_9PLEO|nr:hypothetical protein GQ43DRAFT_474252 [Delitschia confertaspora ATCC 74209]